MPSQNELNLSHTFILSIFDYSPLTGLVYWRIKPSDPINVGDVAGSVKNNYCVLTIQRKKFYAHRIIWFYIHGVWPIQNIDHINGIGTDNRLVNLRECSISQNACNTKVSTKNTSGVKGVYFSKARNKWIVQICVNKKNNHVGAYTNRSDAVNARKIAETTYHGSFSRK